MNRFAPTDQHLPVFPDSDWLHIRIVFTRCCNASFVHPILPSLLVDEIENGRMEPLGWDDGLGYRGNGSPVYAFAALARPCSACLRKAFEASERLWTIRQMRHGLTGSSRPNTVASDWSSDRIEQDDDDKSFRSQIFDS
ncbi:uncharacterized protein MYCFIDRAFT_203314 [Pseudocercospora fijiensis CIRAD86]|uniref:Uncharacterized protein n=1 Tax=Pseudocercospora fijiensis (strain CIRAD86) TaxID=383855 RepID=M3ADF5_PSEFD|nr:uncharacterized protein MYCFIDRAFT_203314 [Pseudocercospora fijiensis CIRAD86]EME82576.1 hypothetical protein MYCFIDRAFT_203314 [Pseudocercospora fijiensis CIRAD86]